MVELLQHGSAMVTALPLIDATGQRGSVHAPNPPVYTNSSWGLAPLGLRHPPMVVPPPPYPVEFWPVNAFGRVPWARDARVPFTYN
ncbi:hypothetical protein GCM10029964_096850 [Kibdelosporangium lantanae]